MATFETWMATVDRILARQCSGFDSQDLPDYCWKDLWEEGLTATEAVEDFREELLTMY